MLSSTSSLCCLVGPDHDPQKITVIWCKGEIIKRQGLGLMVMATKTFFKGKLKNQEFWVLVLVSRTIGTLASLELLFKNWHFVVSIHSKTFERGTFDHGITSKIILFNTLSRRKRIHYCSKLSIKKPGAGIILECFE